MNQWWRERLGQRPWWMNLLMGFCAFMAILYLPWDFFAKPVARDAEAWFGFLLHGWAAKLTEPVSVPMVGERRPNVISHLPRHQQRSHELSTGRWRQPKKVSVENLLDANAY